MSPENQPATNIAELHGISPATLHNEIIPAAQPIILRGLVRDWPVVQAAEQSPEALAAYLKRFDQGASLCAMFGPPGIDGRFFYNDDLSGFNFRKGTIRLPAALDLLLEYSRETRPSSLAVQSVPVRANAPGFERENRMPLLGDAVEPRLWLGNRVTVAAHHDPSENIACVAAGRRIFTLFPPEQVANLYTGPFESTPAGPAISMVDFAEPDLARFPRFAEAMKHAVVVELEPGDALYIPYLWWHHVQSVEPVNMLVNYWWAPDVGRGRPMDALILAMLSVRDLPPAHRDAWRAMFDHYVFEAGLAATDHLPPTRRGMAGLLDAPAIRAIRTALAQTLMRN